VGIEPTSENGPERRLRAYFVIWFFRLEDVIM